MKPLSYSTIILIRLQDFGPSWLCWWRFKYSALLCCTDWYVVTDVSKEHGYQSQSHFTILHSPLRHCQVLSTHVPIGSESQIAWIYLMYPFSGTYTCLRPLHPEDEGTPETSVTIHKLIWCNTAADLKIHIHIYYHTWIPFVEMAQFSIFEDSDPLTMLLTHNPKYLKQFSQHNECKINLMVERCCNALKCVNS
jgi:hypothetical protein